MLVLGSPNHVSHWADLPRAFLEILKLEKTDLTDTVLTGTELDSVKTLEMTILCRTRIPDRTINSSGY